jgi:hypothetical protein
LIWNFCYAKDKNVPNEMRGEPGVGSMWTWTGMCADTKLVFAWQLGSRDSANAYRFMASVSDRLANRVQLTRTVTRHICKPSRKPFGADIDYGMLVKLYGGETGGRASLQERREGLPSDRPLVARMPVVHEVPLAGARYGPIALQGAGVRRSSSFQRCRSACPH